MRVIPKEISGFEYLASELFGAAQPYTSIEASCVLESVAEDDTYGQELLDETYEFEDANISIPQEDWTCECDVTYTPPPGSNEWILLKKGMVLRALYWKNPADTARHQARFEHASEWEPRIEYWEVSEEVDRQRRLKKKEFKYYAGDYQGRFEFDVRPKMKKGKKGKTGQQVGYELRLHKVKISILTWQEEMDQVKLEPKKLSGEEINQGTLKLLAKAHGRGYVFMPEAEERDLRAKVKSLEEANAKLKRRLDRHEGTVLDLTAEDSDDDEAPPRSKLRELHDKQTTKRVDEIKKERDDHESRVAKVTKERDDHESRGELLDSMVTPLESQRRELQQMVSAAAEALMERDVPTRMLADDAAPFYYSQNSWEAEQEIPWNAEADRPMSLAEGIAWVHDNAKPPRKRRR